MIELNGTGLTVLAEEGALRVSGGSVLTGHPELARDIGRVIGAAIGAYMQVGKSLYRGGGITGTNRWLRAV